MSTPPTHTLTWEVVDGLDRFTSRSGSERILDRVERAPDLQYPNVERLELLRVPPTRPWRLERATRFDGQPLVAPAAAQVPGAFRSMLESGHHYGRDLYSLVTMWVDSTHDWVYGMVGSDQLATRRWLHPLFRPPEGHVSHDDWRDVGLTHDLLASIWWAADPIAPEDIYER